MKGIFQFILQRKLSVLILFLVSAALCGLLARTVCVNYNLADYLPEDAPSTIGLKLMQKDYKQDVPNARVMVPNVTIPEALLYKERIEAVDGVEEVSWLDDEVNVEVPLEMLDKKTVESWCKDSNALYSVTIQGGKQVQALQQVRAIIGDGGAMSGASVNTAEAQVNTNAEIIRAMMIVIPIVLVILLLTTSSWFEPLLFLFTIGIAIAINMGTNVFFGEISSVTKTAASILQLAVSMDYSIFLLHRFAEFRAVGQDVNTAMQSALEKSFSSILSSGVTTVIGFAALILMRFRIGPDMGWVMVKAIFLSLLCVLVLLPVLGVFCYKLIDKTRHRSLTPELVHFRKVVTNIRVPVLIVFVLVAIPAFLAHSKTDFSYGSSNIISNPQSRIVQDRTCIEDTFGKSNQMVLMVPKGNVAAERVLSDELRGIPQITSVVSYVDAVGEQIPMEFVPQSKVSKLISPNFSRMLLTVNTDFEGDEVFSLIDRIHVLTNRFYPQEHYLVGESVNTHDIKSVVVEDNSKVNWIAIGAVAVVLILTFQSLALPLLLLLVIEASVWLNLCIPYFQGTHLFFLAYLIINSVQLGATVDYAILFTNRFLENRALLPKIQAIQQTVADTTVSILTSASIMTVCGFILGLFSTNGVISQLGILVGRGAIFSAVAVLFVLPALLALFDGIIQKTTLSAKFSRERD